MTAWELREGDCLDALRAMPDASVDAIVTDPPYGLSDHDADDVADALRAWLAGEPYRPAKKGFMGKAWDGFVPGPEVWRECLRVLKPGGHLVAFAGTRTMDLMGLAIRLVGFEVRDSLAWITGQGFPKSKNLPGGLGTALKPAFEPVILARKPLAGTVAQTVEAHGTGALNVDACRVGRQDGDRTEYGRASTLAHHGSVAMGKFAEVTPYAPHNAGRWPPNVILGCCGADPHAEGCPVAELDRQSGVLRARGNVTPTKRRRSTGALGWGVGADGPTDPGDTGTASRFFPQFRYCAKASRAEREAGCEDIVARVTHDGRATSIDNPYLRAETQRRNHHPTVKPVALMRWLCRLITPPGGLILDPFTGSGTTGVAALLEGRRFVGIEREAEYAAIARARLARAADEADEPAADTRQLAIPGTGDAA